MIKRTIFFLTVLIAFQNIKAQEDISGFDEILSFHPFHLVNNGIRIDYDRKIKDNSWIQIGPQFYASERTEDKEFRDYKELLGVGVSVYHRIYVGNQKPSLGTYFSYGFNFSHFNLKYGGNNQVSGMDLDETDINKFGGDIVIGHQSLAFDRLIIDVYAGLGGRYSDRNFKGNTHRKFNQFLYDYGYTGNVLLLGVRIGFGF